MNDVLWQISVLNTKSNLLVEITMNEYSQDKKKAITMRYNQLGDSGLRVSQLCLGGMTLSITKTNEW